MNKKMFVAEGPEGMKVYGHSEAEARRKYNEFLRNPLLNTPRNRLGDSTYQPPDRSNVSEMCRIREATEEEMRDAEVADFEGPETKV